MACISNWKPGRHGKPGKLWLCAMLFLLQGGDPCLLKVEDGLVIIMSFSIELRSVPPNPMS